MRTVTVCIALSFVFGAIVYAQEGTAISSDAVGAQLAGTDTASPKRCPSGAEVVEAVMDAYRETMPTEDEFKELQEITGCPDCIPSDLMKMGNWRLRAGDYSQIQLENAFVTNRGEYYVTLAPTSDIPSELINMAGFWISGTTMYPVQAKGGLFERDKINTSIIDAVTNEQVGTLTVDRGCVITCADRTHRLSFVPADEKEALAQKIRDKEIALADLSGTREPIYLFQIRGTDIHIYVDSLKFQPGAAIRFFMGKMGNLSQYEVKNFYYFRDGGTKIIRIKNTGILYIPQDMFPDDKKPFWKPADSDERQHVEMLGTDIDTLQRAGVDITELKIPALKTPCSDLGHAQVGSDPTHDGQLIKGEEKPFDRYGIQLQVPKGWATFVFDVKEFPSITERLSSSHPAYKLAVLGEMRHGMAAVGYLSAIRIFGFRLDPLSGYTFESFIIDEDKNMSQAYDDYFSESVTINGISGRKAVFTFFDAFDEPRIKATRYLFPKDDFIVTVVTTCLESDCLEYDSIYDEVLSSLQFN